MRSRGQHWVLLLTTVLVVCAACDTPDPTIDPPADSALGAPLRVRLRWGGGEAGGEATQWNGELRLDCGRVTSVRFLNPEIADGDGITLRTTDVAGARVRWRSVVHGDFDGIEATILPCRADDRGDTEGSTLQVVTPARRWTARLAWSRDDFVSLPVGTRGQHLEIGIRPLAGHTPASTLVQPGHEPTGCPASRRASGAEPVT